MNYENFKMVTRHGFKQGEVKNYGHYLSDAYMGKKPESIVTTFDSCSDIVRCVDENIKNSAWQKYGEESHTWAFGSDINFNSIAKTSNALLTGKTCDEHIRLVEQLRAQLVNQYPKLQALKEMAFKRKRRRQFNEDDGELDIDRYMTGDPTMFVKARPTLQKGMVCRLHYESPTSSGNGMQDFINNMAICAAIIDILESSGVSVEMTFGYSGPDTILDARNTSLFIVAKNAADPFDVNRLMTYGLPGLLRYYAFQVWWNLHLGNGCHEGMGQQGNIKDYQAAYNFINADIYIVAHGILRASKVDQIIDDVEKHFNLSF